MNPLDIVFIVLIAAGAIRCAFKGFIAEFMSFAALILGVAAAVFFSKQGAVLIDTHAGFSNWNQIIAFLIIFILVYLLVKLLEGILHRIIDRIHLDRLDRVLGFFLGLVEGSLAVVLIIYIMRAQPIFDLQPLLDQSAISRFVLEMIPVLAPRQTGGGTIDV